ncbi:MAG TPA: choice-of-anchor D domain-containing protein [Terracidiphilus sp.]|nr:choice-of-anchor D domain-containing protein [Terracidiphilus sp.]
MCFTVNVWRLIVIALVVALGGTAPGQSATASTHADGTPATPPRVAQALRFLAQRGHPKRRSFALSDRPRNALIAPAASASTSPSTAVWQPLGPLAVITPNYGLVTGRISSIAIDPSDPTGNRVVVGTTGGGVWLSQNAGTAGSVTFTPVTETPAGFDAVRYASISIGAVSVQPGGTGVILAGTGDPNDALDSYYGAGVLRSPDGGNTWTVMSHTANAQLSFQGEGFAGFAWSAVNPQLVVAAVSEAYEGTLVSAELSGVSCAGLYYSTDAGASWSLATITDSPGQDPQGPQDMFASPNGNSATAVVWNPIRQIFIAAVRFHGYYQSSDGITWTRMTAQPGVSLTTRMCPTNIGSIGSIACPIFRGALAVNPITGDTFAWTVDLNNQDQGLWQDQCSISGGACSNQTVAFAQRWNTAPLETNTILGAATIANGDYNLVLAAVPAQQDTLLIAGANDLWRCSLAMGCAWRNSTNAFTCMSAQVASYQHALAWNPANPLEVFVGNDSGLWRSTDGVGETGSPCSPTDASHFQNLNSGLGSIAEVENMSQVGASPYTMMVGLGANGTAGVKGSSGPTSDWPQVLGGEGGPVAIDPDDQANWYVNNSAGVSIFRCSQAEDCNPGAFGSTPIVNDADVAGDGYTMTSPAPFIIDPLDTTQLLVGTCRLWRGPADGSSWTSVNAISPILDGVSGLKYCSGDALIRSIAALPLLDGTEVIYVGMRGALDGGAVLAGHFLKATYSPAGSTMPAWQDLTLNPVVNDQVRLNYYGLDVSSIFIDPHDASGNTVYITIEGAEDSLHAIRTLYRTTDGGGHWNELTSNLPHSPANAVLIDPQDANTAYIATDEGVYSTREIAACFNGPSNCWSVFGTGLPFAPVTQLSASPTATSPNVLVAGTYGRGTWQIPMWTSGTQLTTASAQPDSLTFASQTVGTASNAQTITLTNSGGIALAVTSISASASFNETDNCVNVAVNAGASCAVQVTSEPGQTGSIAGQLTINANIPGGQTSIPLSGAGLSTRLVTALPAMLNFGRVQVGATSSSLAVTVENSSGSAIPLSSVAATVPFAVASNSCGSSLVANSDCAISVTFTPTQVGAVTGSLVLFDGAGSQAVALNGTGASAASDVLYPLSLTFPAIATGEQSNAQTATLTNNGDLPLNSIDVTVNAGYQQSNTCGTSLSGHASCAISVLFAPNSTGSITGNLEVSDAIRTQSIALSGTGLLPPAIGVNPTQLTFPSQPIAQAGPPLTLTISNTGGAPMSSIAFQITGSSASSFTWGANGCGATLNSEASCAVQIAFSPASAGQLTATLIVTSSTRGVIPVQVPLRGIGQAPSGITVIPEHLSFTEPTLGQPSAAQTVTITNSSSVAATGINLSVLPPFSLVQDACGSTIAAGSNCTSGIIFTPSANGVVTGVLNVSSSTFATAAVAALSGSGGAAGSVQVQPAALAFPATGIGNNSPAQTVTLTNKGDEALSALTLSTSNGFQLGLTTCTISLAVGASCSAQVLFFPTSAGQQTGNLTVASSSLATSAQSPLSGMGFDFSVVSNGQSRQTVSSGQSATFALNIATIGGSSGTFTFTCGSLPTNSSCIFNPPNETVSANATGSVTVKIATGLASTSAQNIGHAGSFASGSIFLGLGLFMVPVVIRCRRRGSLLLALLILSSFGVTSCAGAGGGGGGAPPSSPANGTTPPGTYSVVVTTAANGLSHKITLNLTVD